MSGRKSPSATRRMVLAACRRDLRRAIHGIDGLPVGAWAATEQAERRISDEIPDGYTLRDVLYATTIIDAQDRYLVTIGDAS